VIRRKHGANLLYARAKNLARQTEQTTLCVDRSDSYNKFYNVPGGNAMNYLEHDNLMHREMINLVCKDSETYWSDLHLRYKEYLYGLHEIMVADPRDIFVDSDNENVIDILKQLSNGDTSNLARLPSLLKANKESYYESYIGEAYDDLVNNLDDYWNDGHDDQTDMASAEFEREIA